jgi:hypothetical protein
MTETIKEITEFANAVGAPATSVLILFLYLKLREDTNKREDKLFALLKEITDKLTEAVKANTEVLHEIKGKIGALSKD